MKGSEFMSPRDHEIILWWVGRLNTKVSYFYPKNIKQIIDLDTVYSSINHPPPPYVVYLQQKPFPVFTTMSQKDSRFMSV